MVEKIMNNDAEKKIIQLKENKEAAILYHVGRNTAAKNIGEIKIYAKEDYVQDVLKFLKEEGWNCTIGNAKPKGRPKTTKIETVQETAIEEPQKKRGRKPGRKPKTETLEPNAITA